jgi:Fic family protein
MTIADDIATLLLYIRRDALLTDENLSRFMIESNAIEGEDGLHPNDLKAARRFLSGPMTSASLLKCHGLLAQHLAVDWGGKYRDCNVRVGGYLAPDHEQVPALMRAFFRELPDLDSWEAHCRFEKIHPFRDLNGRTGRLIWLHKALDEGYVFQRGFLHQFYYSTLSHLPALIGRDPDSAALG